MPKGTFIFLDFCLDQSKRKLSRNGSEIKLSDNEFDLLSCLIENRPNICSHDQIIESVWGRTHVENNSVEKTVVTLRRALGDNAKAPQFIKNRRGQGYAFICDVVEAGEDDAQDSVSTESSKSSSKLASFWLYSGIVAIALSLFLGVGWLRGSEMLERFTSESVFADEFSGIEPDVSLWETMGKAASAADGKLRLSVEETDNPGIVYSKFFAVDPGKKLTIKSRLKISFSRNMKNETYFGGVFGFIQKSDELDNLPAHQNTDAENRQFTGLRYMNYDSQKTFSGYEGETLQEVPTEGFFIVRDGGRPNAKAEYQAGKISERIAPVWDKWFEQKIEYDPVSGEMTYFADGEKKGDFNVGPLKAKDNQIRLLIMPWGWWVNHSMEIDYIRVSQ